MGPEIVFTSFKTMMPCQKKVEILAELDNYLVSGQVLPHE